MSEEMVKAIKDILKETKDMNKRLDMILEAFKSWQSQDENYHNRAEKIMKGGKG